MESFGALDVVMVTVSLRGIGESGVAWMHPYKAERLPRRPDGKVAGMVMASEQSAWLLIQQSEVDKRQEKAHKVPGRLGSLKNVRVWMP